MTYRTLPRLERVWVDHVITEGGRILSEDGGDFEGGVGEAIWYALIDRYNRFGPLERVVREYIAYKD